MGDSQFHSLIVVDFHVGGSGIYLNIIVVKNYRGVANLKVLHPRIGIGKSQNEGSEVVILQHK